MKKSNEYKFKPDIKKIQKFIIFLLRLISDKSTEVSIRFCGTQEMIQTNLKFKNKNKSTDVLSFPFIRESMQGPVNLNYLGDILICIPVLKIQAAKAKHSLSSEIIKMLIHALVHLKGFDHERSTEAERVMSKLEQSLMTELRKKFGLLILRRKIAKCI